MNLRLIDIIYNNTQEPQYKNSRDAIVLVGSSASLLW